MDKVTKFLLTLATKDRQIIRKIYDDIFHLNIKNYDVKPLQGYKNFYRLRKGKIRIVFYKQNNHGEIVDADFRKNIYKNL